MSNHGRPNVLCPGYTVRCSIGSRRLVESCSANTWARKDRNSNMMSLVFSIAL